MCTHAGAAVAIKVDGPTHAAASVPAHVLGATTARTRMLGSLGLLVVRVPQN
jgi:hypothetical protein